MKERIEGFVKQNLTRTARRDDWSRESVTTLV